MNMREIRAVLSRGGKIGFAGADGVCEVSLRAGVVRIVITPFDDEEPEEIDGDFAYLFELIRKVNAAGVNVYEVARGVH